MYDAYTSSEGDPRLAVARFDLCPALPPDTDPLYLYAVQDDRRGLLFHYENGSNLTPMTARVTAVFSQDTLYGYRMRSNAISLRQDEEISRLMDLAGVSPGPRPILALQCRYTAYFNWCLEEQGLYFDAVDPSALRHYMLISGDEWYDVLSTCPPRVYVRRFGARLSDGALKQACPEDAIFYE